MMVMRAGYHRCPGRSAGLSGVGGQRAECYGLSMGYPHRQLLTDLLAPGEEARPVVAAPVAGWPYVVTSSGRVFRCNDGIRARPLRAQFNTDGYRHVTMCFHNRQQTVKICRLVMTAFVGPRPEGMVICHTDGSRDNDFLNNLRYDTVGENIADIYRHGHDNPPRGSTNGMSKLTEANVHAIRSAYAAGGTSHSKLALVYGVSREQVRDIVNRKYWRHI